MVQTAARWTTYRVPDTLPDDTEERIVGTEWHQEASGDSAGKLREAARRRGARWGVCEQVALAGLRHEDGRPYSPRPDVMVLAQPLVSGALSTVALDDVGAPLLVIEEASRSTVQEDIGDKRLAYEAIGVRDYLIYDPDGSLLSVPLLAWRLAGDRFVPWKQDADGLWRSGALDVAFRATQPLLTVLDHAGQEIPTVGMLHRLLEEERRQLAEERQRRLTAEAELRRRAEPHERDT